MTLTEFLLARIAEDEGQAKMAGGGTWNAKWGGEIVAGYGSPIDGEALGSLIDRPTVDHVARHDPARVLAECEAKRKAIDAAWADHERIEGEWGMSQTREQMDAKGDAPDVVTALAAVYADHPDYRTEWTA